MTGRPRQFDEQEALEHAMHVFWERGYESASMCELLDAMGLSRQSCYNTFGEKRALFLRAITHYGNSSVAAICDRLGQGESPLANVRLFLEEHAQKACESGCRGCMIVNSIVEFGNQDKEVSRILRRLVSHLEKALETTLEQAQKKGEISLHADPAQLAKFVTHVAFGFAALGKIKMCKESSTSVVTVALNALDAA